MPLESWEKQERRELAAHRRWERQVQYASYEKGELEIDKKITIQRKGPETQFYTESLTGTVAKMTEKAVMIDTGRKNVWFPKSALLITKGPKDEVFCRIAKWFTLSVNQKLLFRYER